MVNTVVLTYIHTEFYGTEQFRKSCKHVGLPVHNAWNAALYNGTVGSIMYMLYKALVELKDKYTHVIYSDGADTYFLKPFQPPEHLLVSVEKCCFPDPATADTYFSMFKVETPWKFVNAGNWCGPIPLVIEFFEKYKLNTHRGSHVNGQREWHHAFLSAKQDDFSIVLDWKCEFMQSTAFEDPGDFAIRYDRELEVWPKMITGKPKFINLRTETEPCVLHGNGRTDMSWLYETFK